MHDAGSSVQFHCIPGKAHGMISGAAEMRLLMVFWAQSLRNRPMHANTADGPQTEFVEVHSGADLLARSQAQ